MESMWNVPFHVYSIWNPGWGWNEKIAEDSPKNVPYGIHGMDGGIHPFHMESIWNIPGSVKTSYCRSSSNVNTEYLSCAQTCDDYLFEHYLSA